jgi:hypothetical protein
MAVSANINDLLKYELSARDREWEHAFLHAFAQAKLKILNDAPSQGPDGWPYLLVEINDEASEPAYKVLSWLSDKGIGLVVNPTKETPDYVFTYGMIWNYRERGEFLSNSNADKDRVTVQKINLADGQKMLVGPPSDTYLPPYARTILKSFFRDNGLPEMRVLLMTENEETEPKQYDLCFSLEALGAPEQHEHKGILEALSWFLPAHYSLMVISEQGLPTFTNL